MHSGPWSKSALCVQGVDWTSDQCHCHCLSFFLTFSLSLCQHSPRHLAFHTVAHWSSDIFIPPHSHRLKLGHENKVSFSHGSGASVIVPQAVEELVKVPKVLALRRKHNNVSLNSTSWKTWSPPQKCSSSPISSDRNSASVSRQTHKQRQSPS